jgi:hypothetical protein
MKMINPAFIKLIYVQDDSKLLSGFPWPLNENSDNNLESHYISYTKGL